MLLQLLSIFLILFRFCLQGQEIFYRDPFIYIYIEEKPISCITPYLF